MKHRFMISAVEVRAVPDGEPVHVTNAHLMYSHSHEGAAMADRAMAIERECVSPIIVSRVIPYSVEEMRDPEFTPDKEELWLYAPHEVGDKLRMVYTVWNECFKERDRYAESSSRYYKDLQDACFRIQEMENAPWWRRLFKKW